MKIGKCKFQSMQEASGQSHQGKYLPIKEGFALLLCVYGFHSNELLCLMVTQSEREVVIVVGIVVVEIAAAVDFEEVVTVVSVRRPEPPPSTGCPNQNVIISTKPI